MPIWKRPGPGIQKWSLIAFILCPVFIMYGILYREMLPFPIADDYHALLAFDLHLHQLHSVSDQLLYIAAAQHVDYKLIFEHSIFAAQLLLLHHVSIPFLVVLGNLLLIPVLAIYWFNYFRVEPDPVYRLLLFAPVPWLLFQLNYAETVDWTMAGLQNIAVVTFACTATHFLVRNSRQTLVYACLFAALACAASVNGFALAPIGFLFLIFQKRYRGLIGWTLPFVVMLPAYLYRYTFRAPGTLGHVGLAQKIRFFLSFLGGAVENMHGYPIHHASLALGFCIALICLIAVGTGYLRDNPFACLMMFWILLTGAMVTSGRAFMGAEYSLSSRYKIYSDLLLIFCYGFIAERLRARSVQPRTRTLFLAGSICFTVLVAAASDASGYGLLKRRRILTVSGLQQYRESAGALTPTIYPEGDPITPERLRIQEDDRLTLNEAIQQKIYTLPAEDPKDPRVASR